MDRRSQLTRFLSSTTNKYQELPHLSFEKRRSWRKTKIDLHWPHPIDWQRLSSIDQRDDEVGDEDGEDCLEKNGERSMKILITLIGSNVGRSTREERGRDEE